MHLINHRMAFHDLKCTTASCCADFHFLLPLPVGKGGEVGCEEGGWRGREWNLWYEIKPTY